MIAGRYLGTVLLLGSAVVGGSACRQAEKPREVRRQEQPAGNSAAREVGRGAYKATQGAEKALKKAGQELGQGIKEAAAGWKEASRDSKARKPKD